MKGILIHKALFACTSHVVKWTSKDWRGGTPHQYSGRQIENLVEKYGYII
jgi:hypothetical protein